MTTTTTAESPVAAKPVGVKFGPGDGFFADLKCRINDYFKSTGYSQRDCVSMYIKTAIIMGFLLGSYTLLVFVISSWWLAIPLAVVLGLAIAAVGMNIQHDAAHNAYSRHAWINRTMSLTLDLVGGSSYLWDWKHNSLHHTYTNIAGEDTDIELGVLGRLSPEQPRLWFHRMQQFYLWLLYGFLTVKWHLVDDFHSVAVGRVGQRKIPRPKGKDLALFIAGKAIFFTLAFVIPMLLHPIWTVLVVYGIAAFICGVTLSVVFQLAHCVEEAEFPVPDENGRMETDWAVHQVKTTADFAPRNRVLSCLLGGLNFQVEHHLLNRICHVHYPAISKLVEETCQEHGLQYNVHRSFFGALASHFRWLRRMGAAD